LSDGFGQPLYIISDTICRKAHQTLRFLSDQLGKEFPFQIESNLLKKVVFPGCFSCGA